LHYTNSFLLADQLLFLMIVLFLNSFLFFKNK
jgi:hypothetical protein